MRLRVDLIPVDVSSSLSTICCPVPDFKISGIDCFYDDSYCLKHQCYDDAQMVLRPSWNLKTRIPAILPTIADKIGIRSTSKILPLPPQVDVSEEDTFSRRSCSECGTDSSTCFAYALFLPEGVADMLMTVVLVAFQEIMLETQNE